MTGRDARTNRSKTAGGRTAARQSASGFSGEERAAMKDLVRERSVVWGKDRSVDEAAVVARIEELPEPDRAMARRLHAVITTAAPNLSPRLWYGMPAYTKAGDVLCFFQSASKFRARYATLGFSDKASLDDGAVWPTSFAVKRLTNDAAAKIAALLRKAARGHRGPDPVRPPIGLERRRPASFVP